MSRLGNVDAGRAVSTGRDIVERGIESFDRNAPRFADVAEYGIERSMDTIDRGLDVVDRGIAVFEENKDFAQKEIRRMEDEMIKIVKMVVRALVNIANQITNFFKAFKALMVLLTILLIIAIIYLIVWMGVGIKWMIQTWLVQPKG